MIGRVSSGLRRVWAFAGAAALGCLLCAPASVGRETCGYRNLGFEEGVKGWRVWYSDDPNDSRPRYPYVADEQHAHSGRRSLRITATARGGRAFVHQSSTALKPNTRYEVSYWYRPQGIEESAFTVVFNLRQRLPGGKLGPMKRLAPMIFQRQRRGEWRRRVGRMRTFREPCSAQLGIYLRDAVGTLWVDDIVVRELTAEEDALADMWEYDPHRVELLAEPERRFRKLTQNKAPILKLAQAYNWALVRSAFAKDEVQRCARAALYARAHGIQADPAELRARCRKMEDNLASLYRLYGKAFLSQTDRAASPRFTEAARRLEKDIADLRADARKAIHHFQDKLKAAGKRWQGQPPPPSEGLPEIAPDGTPNQIIYGTRSLWNHALLEAPLDINVLHCLSVPYPRSAKPGQYDWSPYFQRWKDMTAACPVIQRACMPIWFAVHDTSYCPSWLRRRMKTDPELLGQTDPPQELRKRNGRMQLNWWHPEIRKFARECLTDMGRTMKPHREFLFYIFQAECQGPVVSVEGAPWQREVGYSSHGKRHFRQWLREKYGGIGALNEAWGARYKAFEEIPPPADKFVTPRKQATPLSSEWEKWREDSYVDWCKLIYQSLKKADGRPVLASHSQLLDRVNAARAYETCDILGYHNRAPRFMVNTIYINTISRYNGFKPIGQYENFWGCQEHHDRMTEELVQRRNMQKHVFRLTAWGRFVQIWWYAYTTAWYLTHYDGNWFDPVYALTTLRYRTAGLPVYKDKFKRLERVLLASRLAHHRICVLQPSASMRNQYPYGATVQEIHAWFGLLFPRNDLFEIVPEEYFLDGRARLGDFDVVILPYAVYLPAKLQRQIEAWLAKGRKLLIASGPFALYDEIARPTRLYEKLLGAGRPEFVESTEGGWLWRAKGGGADAGLLKAKRGQGEIVVLLQPLGRAKPDVSAPVVRAVEAAAPRPAFSRNDRLELVLREGDKGSRYLLAINPDVDKVREDVVTVRGSYSRADDIDLDGAFPIALELRDTATSFRLRLDPCGMTVIRLTP